MLEHQKLRGLVSRNLMMLTSLQMSFVARLEEVRTFREGAGPSYWPGDVASKVVPYLKSCINSQ